MKRLGLVLPALVASAFLAAAPRPAAALDGGRYGEVRLVQPTAAMRGFVIYFSDRGGWRPSDQAALESLGGAGALAVGVDTDTYLARIAPSTAAYVQLVCDA